jgi:hypothetical protein
MDETEANAAQIRSDCRRRKTHKKGVGELPAAAYYVQQPPPAAIDAGHSPEARMDYGDGNPASAFGSHWPMRKRGVGLCATTSTHSSRTRLRRLRMPARA